MSTAHTVQTIIEALMILAVIILFVYDPIIADWEQKQKEKVLRAFNKRKVHRR